MINLRTYKFITLTREKRGEELSHSSDSYFLWYPIQMGLCPWYVCWSAHFPGRDFRVGWLYTVADRLGPLVNFSKLFIFTRVSRWIDSVSEILDSVSVGYRVTRVGFRSAWEGFVRGWTWGALPRDRARPGRDATAPRPPWLWGASNAEFCLTLLLRAQRDTSLFYFLFFFFLSLVLMRAISRFGRWWRCKINWSRF